MSREEMETRRLAAVQMLRAGVQQSKVGRRCQVSRTTVSRWAKAVHAGKSLRATKSPGRPPKVSPDDLRRLFEERPSWTGVQFSEAIYLRFGVVYHHDRVGTILKRLRGPKYKRRAA